jgi:hypothetical protein|tara:strand:- start:214 stop:357 length:144 start_codon:yes stop_codon:yes gene_type:complete
MGKVIHKGIDARGQWYKLVRDPETGGVKYIWEKGHVWAGFKGSQIDD